MQHLLLLQVGCTELPAQLAAEAAPAVGCAGGSCAGLGALARRWRMNQQMHTVAEAAKTMPAPMMRNITAAGEG